MSAFRDGFVAGICSTPLAFVAGWLLYHHGAPPQIIACGWFGVAMIPAAIEVLRR